jgi:hypothetical protein
MIEDRPHVLVPAGGETLFVSGWQAHGYLQPAIENASTLQQTGKGVDSPTAGLDLLTSGDAMLSEGTPVIVEVTASCLLQEEDVIPDSVSTTASGSLLCVPLSRSDANDVPVPSASASQVSYFICPVHRKPLLVNKSRPQMKHACLSPMSCENVSIIVPSVVPIQQHVLGGSHLSIRPTIEPNKSSDRRGTKIK